MPETFDGYDDPYFLLGLLGSHWADTYEGKDEVAAFLAGRLENMKQTHQDLLEAQATISRRECPVFHTTRWKEITLRQSECNASPASILRYGDGAYYGNQPDTGAVYTYGVPANDRKYEYPLPEAIKRIALLSNRVTYASKTLVENVDYTIDAQYGRIVFNQNPFENPLFVQNIVLDETGEVDAELTLWAFEVLEDRDYLYRHWGYIFGVALPSSEKVRDLINAVADGVVSGGTSLVMRQLISAVLDTPIVREAQETVEEIGEDSTGQLIITDKHVYRASTASTVSVSVGDVLQQGDSLTDAVEFYELNRGVLPAGITAITLGPELLIGNYLGGLTFQNKLVPVVFEPYVDGETKISFELGGNAADISRFWASVHSRGIANALTLQESWGVSQPAVVNPAEFAVQNLLRNNAFLAKIKVSSQGEQSLGLSTLSQLRKLIPPHTLLIVLAEYAVEFDPPTLGTITASTFTGMTPAEIPIDSGVNITLTSTAELLNADCS